MVLRDDVIRITYAMHIYLTMSYSFCAKYTWKEKQKKAVTTVSYTHLDVYKRQRVNWRGAIVEGRETMRVMTQEVMVEW